MKGKVLQAVVAISGKIDPSLNKTLTDLNKKLGTVEKKHGSTMKKVGKVAAATAAAVAASAVTLGVAATKNAIKYEKQMSNVATLLDGDVKPRIDELSKGLLNVSNVSGKSTDDLTDGLYQVISAFGDSKDTLKTVEIAAKAATAGNATTTDSINLLSAVTKGYGDTSAKAQQKAADLAFMTAKLGQTTFPELAASMGKVIPLANSMGISQEQLFGATATLTGVTGNTAEVMTQLKGTVQGFLQPTKEMESAINKLGFASGKAMLESEGFGGSLELLKKSVKGDDVALSKMFSSVEAKTAVLALAGSQSENLKEKTEAMYKASGAASDAFSDQTNNLATQWSDTVNIFENAKTSIGIKLLPLINDLASRALPYVEQGISWLVDAAGKLGDAFNTYVLPVLRFFKNNMETIVPVIGGVVTAIGVYKGAVIASNIANMGGVTAIMALTKAKLVDKAETAALGLMYIKDAIIKAKSTAATIANTVATGAQTVATGAWNVVAGIATTVTSALGAAFAFLTSTIGLVIVAIAAVVAAGVALYNNWESVKAFAQGLWTRLTEIFGGIRSTIGGALEYIRGKFRDVFGALAGIIKAPMNAVISLINGAISGINLISFDMPKILGGGHVGFDIPKIPLLAKGGFTEGISIAGEAGTEAVLSFDQRYRKENLSYWAKAGQMLGATSDDAGYGMLGGTTTTNNGVTITAPFAPQVHVEGNAEKSSIIQAIRDEYPEFLDMLEEFLEEREGLAYG